MKIKVQDMTPIALNWAVAKAHGENPVVKSGVVYSFKTVAHHEYKFVWEPSINWGQGGPIIEREEISISREFASGRIEWAAWTPAPIRDDAESFGYGPTPLVAAMRCYVASKMGNEVDVPDEIKE